MLDQRFAGSFLALILMMSHASSHWGCIDGGQNDDAGQSDDDRRISVPATKERPNIIFIMADDLGVYDLGVYGGTTIQTPHIDRLASEGMRFTQHYAGSAVCAPSRASLMTGLHTGHAPIRGNFGMELEGDLPMPLELVTVAEVLREAGYRTGIVGKWGLGGASYSGGPNSQGFEESFCYLDQRKASEYYPTHLWEDEKIFPLNGEYSHDLFTERALSYIQAHASETFFLYLPYTIPHRAYQVPDDAPYTDKDWDLSYKNYAAMITRMDRDVGRIVDLLGELDLDERTVVFFTSDNGATVEMSEFFSSNGALRGGKTFLYEGGIRAPLIARWPGTIEAGSTSSLISAFWDFLPTAAEIAGTPVPQGIDGISYLPTLVGESQDEHAFLFWEYFGYFWGWTPQSSNPRNYLEEQAVRMGPWKGLRRNLRSEPDAPLQLFNLDDDPGEETDIAATNADIVSQMQTLLATERTDVENFRK